MMTSRTAKGITPSLGAALAMVMAVAGGACKRVRPEPSERAPAAEGSMAAPAGVAASASAVANEPTEPTEPEEPTAEDANEQCRFRKNSGVVAECGRTKENFGRWAPSRDEVLDALRAAGGICYCAGDLSEPVRSCMAKAGASAVTVKIGKDDEEVDCTVAISAASEGGRRWVKLEAAVRDRATVYSTDSVLERKAKAYVPYYQGFEGLPGDEAIAAAGADDKEITAELKRDWPRLSRPLRAFLRRH